MYWVYCYFSAECHGRNYIEANVANVFFLPRSARQLSVFASFKKESSYGHEYI